VNSIGLAPGGLYLIKIYKNYIRIYTTTDGKQKIERLTFWNNLFTQVFQTNWDS